MKQYNNEKAIISLTSWKKRIHEVARTIFSLRKQCPGFHIVLVLSEDEFPKKEEELPENLLTFLDTDVFELLWVKKNYRSFKKVLFTMDKYKEVPVISADDGCIYIKNYAEELYQEWLKHPKDIISYVRFGTSRCVWGGGGFGILFPPYRFLDRGIKYLTDDIIATNHDDAYYGALCYHLRN